MDTTAALITEIIDQYYTLRQVPLLLASEGNPIQLDLINRIVFSLRHPRLIQLNSTIYDYRSWSYAVFIGVSYESFRLHVNQLNSERYDLFGYYTFVLSEASEAQISDVFKALWKLKMLRTVLIVAKDDEPQLYNYSPYSNHTCGEPTIRRIENHTSSELFVQQLNDFYGCPINLGTFETPPFVHFQNHSINGFEGDLATTLSGMLNFQLLIVTPPDNAQWGDPRPNNGSTGLMKLLQDETVHFGIGCLGIIPQRNEILQPGRPHYNSRVLFAIPEGRPLNSFEKLLQPFDRTVWTAESAVICVIAAVVLILKFAPNAIRDFIYGADNQTPFLNAINIFYTGCLHIVPRRNFARTLLILWTVHCFVMSTVYQGLLFKYLQEESNHKPIDAIEEIERSDLHYYINRNADRFFQHNPSLLSRIHHIAPGNDSMTIALDSISSRRVQDGVVLCTLEHIAYHNKHRLSMGFLRSTRDSLSSYPMVIYYPKRTFLVRVLNRMVGQIETAGLMNYWVRLYGNYNFFPKKIDIAQPTALSAQQLMGCFECIYILWIIGCGVFILELLSLKLNTLRRFMEFLAHK
ncbi:uncharacterized protein LOC135697107 [Ochlerotatus camptorhynchus]|uniref:uncharacterized protein LOC135697107 n=1 Tax=Ochlerotatus camptorhynchus TaxID=644619 RepID=UPI0031D9F671